MKFPLASLPVFDVIAQELRDGGVVPACDFCRVKISASDKACLKHYELMEKTRGIVRMCPYGFTSYATQLRDTTIVVTGVVAHPRFGDAKEMDRAKRYPNVRVARNALLSDAEFYKQVDASVLKILNETQDRLPQALHELRKLNAIVKGNADKLGGDESSQQEIRDISGSADLMSNIFEVIEALANVDNLAQLKLDEFIAVYDLAFKAKKIYQIRAKIRPVHIHVSGDESVSILGSKKVFPLVLTILLENAIKYAKSDTTIDIKISVDGSYCLLSVWNRSDIPIDVNRCFLRGTRYSNGPPPEGDGLGLFLASEIVKAHGGTISCVKNSDLISMGVRIPVHVTKVRKAW